MLDLSSAVFFSTFLKKIFQDYYQSDVQFESRTGPKFCRARTGSNLFPNVTSRHNFHFQTFCIGCALLNYVSIV